MESHNLYRVKEEDLDKLIRILTVCFSEDPLYHALIPDRDTRERLMPELFTCDLTEFFETCEIYADSSELNSILVVSDGTEHEAALHNLMVDFFALLKTDGYLIKEDPSLATLRKFIQGKDYLNSSWTSQLHTAERLHVIYLAVAPKMQRPVTWENWRVAEAVKEAPVPMANTSFVALAVFSIQQPQK